MAWKLFGMLTAALWVGGVLSLWSGGHALPLTDLVAIPIDTVATAGVLFFAFGFGPRSPSIWRPVATGYALWSLCGLAIGTACSIHDGSSVPAIVAAILAAGMLYTVNWIALRRLGTGAPTPG